jgi:hypothetical protein
MKSGYLVARLFLNYFRRVPYARNERVPVQNIYLGVTALPNCGGFWSSHTWCSHARDSPQFKVGSMDEIERDKSWRGGGPTYAARSLPYLSTFQPSQQGFYRVHGCEGELETTYIGYQRVCPVDYNDVDFFKKIKKILRSCEGRKIEFQDTFTKYFFDLLSHLSGVLKSYDCTETLVLYILLSLYG